MQPISAREFPAPIPNVETQHFWDAAKEGRLLIKHCIGCDKAHWYPREVCPFCQGGKTLWRQASGKGTIYSYSVMRRAAVPFATAYVTLEEGPTMLSNIVDCDFDALAIGMPVEVCFAPTQSSDLCVPVFRPLPNK
ncbi:MAG: OB-fold domain-containing protein [Burkholderiaceae bacterium]